MSGDDKNGGLNDDSAPYTSLGDTGNLAADQQGHQRPSTPQSVPVQGQQPARGQMRGDFADEPTPPPRPAPGFGQPPNPEGGQGFGPNHPVQPNQGFQNRPRGPGPNVPQGGMPGPQGHQGAQTGAQQGFNVPPTGQHQFNTPASDPHPQPGQGFPTTGNSLPAVGGGEEVTPKTRAIYGGGGFIAGLLVGLLLGILNSALEGISLGDGFGLTLQISGWFAILFGVACALKPERVQFMLREWGLMEDE